MKNEYIVRGYLLSQHMLPFYKVKIEDKERAICLAEVLLEDKKFHYVTIINHKSDEPIIEMKKELVL